MFENKSTAQEIIERLSTSYGVKSQRELAKALDIPPNNVSAWAQRGSVPGNSIIKCALDTGADLNWLVNGELANANLQEGGPVSKGKALYDEIMSNGGKPVLRRIMDAYGFNLQKQLCDLLEISSGTVSTWVRRDYFPGDVVVACALDTGVSLQWLATGKGLPRIDALQENYCPSIPRKNLSAGVLQDAGVWKIDLNFFPQPLIEPVFIYSSTASWIVDKGVTEISNGEWLLGIDDKYDIYDITLIPGRKLSITSKTSNFLCGADEIKVAGQVVLSLQSKI
ncbi:helix-turn-helix domain-containing protein [Buttiauxella sp.]|uniref:phage repressor protein CI n=1 Tax=Buttiauxella sp. TaxID=1972222 RepID=UPI003C76319C